MHSDKNELEQAAAEYLEALEIRRQLTKVNPSAYLPKVATTLINLAIFHLSSKIDRELSIKCVIEAVQILLPIVERLPFTQKYLQSAIGVLQRWGLSKQEIEKLLKGKRSH